MVDRVEKYFDRTLSIDLASVTNNTHECLFKAGSGLNKVNSTPGTQWELVLPRDIRDQKFLDVTQQDQIVAGFFIDKQSDKVEIFIGALFQELAEEKRRLVLSALSRRLNGRRSKTVALKIDESVEGAFVENLTTKVDGKTVGNFLDMYR